MKYKLSTRISCALLTLIMVFLFIPTNVYAAIGDGVSLLAEALTPDPSTLTYIYTADELAKIGKDSDYPLDGSYILMNDISLKDISNWTPIGDSKNPFTGNFLGAGFTIKDMLIDVNKLAPAESGGTLYVGLFGYNKGLIRDLALKGQVSTYDTDGKISETNGNQKSYIGKLVGYSDSFSINLFYRIPCHKSRILG